MIRMVHPYTEGDIYSDQPLFHCLLTLVYNHLDRIFLQNDDDYLPEAGILHIECILNIECSTFHSIIFQDLE